ncbi:MAG: Protein of unknown function, rane YfhO, partial [Pedosphaera sp.]|nr:Protein of unknown function, rane YfhO [Pedosphaera sp.]
VYLEPATKPHITAHRTMVKIISRQFDAQHVGAEIETTAPAMVVVAQTFYHNWHAYVDGQRVKLWRANFGFQALEVPAGRHAVKVIYEDSVFLTGVVISCVSLAALGMIWFLGRRKRFESPAFPPFASVQNSGS